MSKSNKGPAGLSALLPGTKQYKGKALQGQRPMPPQAERMKNAKDTGAAITAPMDGTVTTYQATMPVARTAVANLFQLLSALAALPDLTAEQLSLLHDSMSQWFTSEKAAVRGIADIVRARTMAVLKSIPPTETLPSGTRRWQLGGIVKEARVQKSGLDSSLVEAQLRARHLDPVRYMKTEIKFKVADDTEQLLLNDKVFTPAELEALKYKAEEHLALMPSKPVGGES